MDLCKTHSRDYYASSRPGPHTYPRCVGLAQKKRPRASASSDRDDRGGRRARSETRSFDRALAAGRRR